jgi:hypothetical protein
LLRNPIKGGQGPNWAVEPYDDDDDDDFSFLIIFVFVVIIRANDLPISFSFVSQA